jgi:hypothetical protein
MQKSLIEMVHAGPGCRGKGKKLEAA